MELFYVLAIALGFGFAADEEETLIEYTENAQYQTEQTNVFNFTNNVYYQHKYGYYITNLVKDPCSTNKILITDLSGAAQGPIIEVEEIEVGCPHA